MDRVFCLRRDAAHQIMKQFKSLSAFLTLALIKVFPETNAK